jgi:hypothetical protein
MKWFERRTTDLNDREAKQIERKFGLLGYAIWEKLQQIIAENMDPDNVSEWGFVAKGETMKSLSEKIRCTETQLREFVAFCDDEIILEKKDGRLFCQYVLDRMSEYARKIKKKVKAGKSEDSGKSGNSEKTDFPESSESTKNPRNNTSQHNTVTSQSQEIVISGGKRPEIAPVKPSDNPGTPLPFAESSGNLGDLLARKRKILADTVGNTKNVGITKPWQEKALRYAAALGINLDYKFEGEKDSIRGRWFKVFRQADEEKRKPANLERAFTYLSDHEGNHTTGEKVNFFFHIYENGLQQKNL